MASNAKNLAELLNTDSTVAVGDIADGSVSTAKLADDAVTSAKLGASAVDATALASNAVTTAKVADGAVTQVKTTDVAGRVGRNIAINGAMQVAQRGTSQTAISSAGYYTVDRFRTATANSAGRLTMTQESITDLPGFANAIKFACTTADTSIAAGEYLQLSQYFEGQDLQQLKKGTSSAEKVTVSFYVKGNGNATYMLEMFDGDNTRHNTQQFSVTSSWNRVSLTFDGDTTGAYDDDNALSLYLNFWLHAGSSYSGGSYSANTWAANSNSRRAAGISSFFSSTSNTFFITCLQMEVGDSATDFEHEPFETTLRKCQRYYVRAGGANYKSVFGASGIANTTGSWFGFGHFPVPMRASFSLVQSGGTPRIQNGQAGYNATSVSAGLSETNHADFSMGCNASGLTLYRWHNMDSGASATLFEFDAEL